MTYRMFQGSALRTTLTWTGIVVAAAWMVGVAAQTQLADASDAGKAHRCSVRTLHGSYRTRCLWQSRRPVSARIRQGRAIVSTGLRVYDGNGGFIDRAADLHS